MISSRPPQSLVWHQFLKETREHRFGLLIVLFCSVGYTIAAASGKLETMQTLWAYPLLTKYPWLPFLLTLVPGLFIVPFLAFVDPCNEKDAFWITKPLSTLTIAGAKIVFILIWLIGVPLLGEIIVVGARGGLAHFGPVIFDFILIRAAYFFTALAIASLFGELLKFTIALLCAPLIVAILATIAQSIWPEQSTQIEVTPIVVSSLLRWSIALSIIGLITTTMQYHFRTGRKFGLLFAITTLVLVAVLPQNWDLLHRPVPSETRHSEKILDLSLQLGSPTIVPSPLTALGRPGDRFTAEISILKVPPLYALSLNRIQLTMKTPSHVESIDQHCGDPGLFYETRPAPQRIYGQILSHLKGEPIETSTVPARLSVTLSTKTRAKDWSDQEVSIVGKFTFDVFHHVEFGRLENQSQWSKEPSITRGGTTLVMRSLVEPEVRSLITFINRHFAATCDPKNHELRSNWTPHIVPWYFILKNRQNDTYWETFDDFYNERCRGPAFGALHVSRSTMMLPSSVSPDEVIVFQSRYLGTIERSITLNPIVLITGE